MRSLTTKRLQNVYIALFSSSLVYFTSTIQHSSDTVSLCLAYTCQ